MLVRDPSRRSYVGDRSLAIAPIANIGPRGQQRRLRLGALTFGAASVLGGILFAVGTPGVWRLTLFPLLWVSALGYFQARDKT